jgi:hypothetical protein
MTMSPEQTRKKMEAEKESMHYQKHAFVNGMKSEAAEPMFNSGLDHDAHGSEMQ